MKLSIPQKGKNETLDAFYHGRILVLQKKRGYRFAVDAPLLADFIQTKDSETCLELGTGSGIISLLLSVKPFARITAIEIQDSLADLARRNVQLNHLGDRIQVVHMDFRTFHPGRRFDVVFSNPPYIRSKGGRLSESPEKSIAKHELKCDILGIMQKTAEVLRKEGRAYFIYAAQRKVEFMLAAERNGMKIKTVRFVVPRRGTPPNFLLAELDFVSSSERILPPLVLYGQKGEYTSEALEIFAGRSHVSTS
jgi:tRNA1Val (adenine37-N6)-methyltransferase